MNTPPQSNMGTTMPSKQLQAHLEALLGQRTELTDYLTEITSGCYCLFLAQQIKTGWIELKVADLLGFDTSSTKNAWPLLLSRLKDSDRARFEDETEALAEGSSLLTDLVLQVIHHSGKKTWLRFRGKPMDIPGIGKGIFGMFNDVSYLKQEEENLQKQISRFDAFLEASSMGTWEQNLQTGETLFNQKWAAMLGYDLQELGNIDADTWKKFVHPDDYALCYDRWNEHIAGKTPAYQCEMRMRHRDGRWIWVLDRGRIVTRTTDNKPEWVSGSQQEVDLDRQNQILLSKYQQLRFRMEGDSAIGTWELNLQTNTLYWSDVTRSIHEVPENYTPTMDTALDFFGNGTYKESIVQSFNEAINLGKNFDLELEITTAAGNHRWVRIIGIAVFNNGVCEKVYGILVDIQERTVMLQKLSLEEERFRKTFEFAPIGMALVGLDGKWLKVNKSLLKIIGYTEAELLAITFQDITHPEDLLTDLKLLNELVAGKINAYQMEKRYYHKEGHLVWVLLSVSMVKNERGEPIHFVSQINDITELKSLLETVQDQNKRLLNFAHIVSHNLRSHSSNFALMLDLMKTEHPETADNEFFPMLQKASGNLKETIAHLNEITLIQTKTKQNLETLDLGVFVAKAVNNVQGQLLQHDGVITNNVQTGLKVKAVPAYLDSIVLNFLTNAIKYKHPDRAPAIELNAQGADQYVKLTVADNGVGIDLQKHGDKLFGLYKTFHPHPDSRGIGLFITRNQVEAMGGKVEVESLPGKGTTFAIYLPYEKS